MDIFEVLENYCVVDIETTSLEDDAQILQLCVGTNYSGVLKLDNQFYDCEGNIPPTSSVVHNIVKDDVAGKPLFNVNDKLVNKIKQYPHIFGHGVEFDKRMLTNYGFDSNAKWLCTARFAKRLFSEDPTVENYHLHYLKYRFLLDVEKGQAHDARYDVKVTHALLLYLLDYAFERYLITEPTMSAIVEFINEPIYVSVMPFGKYKGQKLETVPLDYWQWAIDNTDVLNPTSPKYDKDFAASVERALDILL